MQNLPSPQQNVMCLLQTCRAAHLQVNGQFQRLYFAAQVSESQQFLCSALLLSWGLISLWVSSCTSEKFFQPCAVILGGNLGLKLKSKVIGTCLDFASAAKLAGYFWFGWPMPAGLELSDSSGTISTSNNDLPL